ncbi:hypothetical protein M3891_003116 [Vibrio metschnikovii]|nr:hypothetical protein [Vibrio metschnikovii]
MLLKNYRFSPEYSTLVLCFVLIFLNLFFQDSVLGLIVSLPQLIFILVLFLQNKKASVLFYWHVLFTFTTLAIPFAQIINPGEVKYGLYHYSKLKLVGPISVSQIILIAILLKSGFESKVIRISSELKPIFYLLVYFFLSGFTIGLIGNLFDDYYINFTLSYSVYTLMLIMYMLIYFIVRDKAFDRRLSELVIILLLVSPIVSFVLFMLDVRTLYGVIEIARATEFSYYSGILILLYSMFSKCRLLFFVSIASYFFLIVNGGMGGKGALIFILVLSFIMFRYLLSIGNFRNLLSMFMLLVIIVMGVLFFDYDLVADNFKLALYKFESLFLLVKAVFEPQNIALLPNSPKVRVVEIILIYYDLIEHPFTFVFGNGYGGYFIERNSLMSTVDLSTGFSIEEVVSGKYSRPHDSFTVIPFMHGLFGVFVFCYTSFVYLRKIPNNPFYFAVIPFLLLSFYFNHQFGGVGLLLFITGCIFSSRESDV